MEILLLCLIIILFGTLIWVVLEKIKIELAYKNQLIEKQIELLEEQNEILKTK